MYQQTHVTIVGGGTAGWLTAMLLHMRLNSRRRFPQVQITLIESPNTPIIGVGEGTLPFIVQQIRQFGLDENEFLRRCDASFKLGVRFVNWNRVSEDENCSFVHTFGSSGTNAVNAEGVQDFLAFGPHKGRSQTDASDSLDGMGEAIRLNKSPRVDVEKPFEGALRYAYHFDAGLLADFLKEEAVKRGIKHILDDVVDAKVAEGNIISQITLENHGELPIELLIDCTGFKGLFISRFLKEPFVSYGDNLLCDRAIPVQIPHKANEPLQSFTSATALSAGWVWRVPLFSRIGTGYVYSSAFKSDDEAARELCQHLDIDEEKFDPRIIKMQVGRRQNTWVGNCIAIGLSAGFIEPLEATAIFSIQYAGTQLADHFPHDAEMMPIFRKKFNSIMNAFYESIRNFIIMHYYAANREDPFWQAARQPSVLTDSLKDNFETWKYRLPRKDDLPHQSMFADLSYSVCLASKGYFRDRKLIERAPISFQGWQRAQELQEQERSRIRELPSCQEFLSKVRNEPWPIGGKKI